MEFSPTFLDFSSWIYLFWKQTKINLVSKYFRFYLTEQVAFWHKIMLQNMQITLFFNFQSSEKEIHNSKIYEWNEEKKSCNNNIYFFIIQWVCTSPIRYLLEIFEKICCFKNIYCFVRIFSNWFLWNLKTHRYLNSKLRVGIAESMTEFKGFKNTQIASSFNIDF